MDKYSGFSQFMNTRFTSFPVCKILLMVRPCLMWQTVTGTSTLSSFLLSKEYLCGMDWIGGFKSELCFPA